jgi:hypothetical protein
LVQIACMKKLVLLALLFPLLGGAQAVLKPGIGLSALPDDNDTICNIPLYLGSFDSSGLHAGDTAYDFKLYSLAGDSFTLGEKLSHGKPVLLVAGSYTCPVFRNKVAVLNSVASTYSGQIEIAIIYTVEAHPTTISPYFGYVNVTQFNQTAGILYRQPTTYSERKAVCTDLLQNMTVNVPVYLDGPCNAWWNTYGPAPNNAYLIDTSGIVFAKHGWFDRHPDHDIACDIDSLLGLASCSPVSTGGAFTLEPVSTTVSGLPGDILYAHVNIINTTSGYINIGVKKVQPNIPAGWETAFCFQVCFSPTEDSITIQVAPYDTADLSLDFFTLTSSPDSGSMKVGFRNIDNIANAYSMNFRAFTIQNPSSLNDIFNDNNFVLFPNPSSSNRLQVITSVNSTEKVIEFFDNYGRMVYQQRLSTSSTMLPVSHLVKGIYYVRYGSNVKKWVKE